MMYYHLSNDVEIRKWTDASILLDKKTFSYFFLSATEFRDIIRCNGMLNFCIHQESRWLLEKEYVIESNYRFRYDVPIIIYDNFCRINALFSITNKCNLSCKHCFKNIDKSELSKNEIFTVIDRISEFGIVNLSISGGEPLLHCYFTDIMLYSMSKGIRIDEIKTNGTLITDSLIAFLKSMPNPPEICISFDGIGSHNWLRNFDCENVVLNNISKCVSAGLKINVTMSLHKGNLHSMEDTIEELSKLKVSEIYFGKIINCPTWSPYSEYTLSSEEEYSAYLNILKYIVEKRPKIDIKCGSMLKYEFENGDFSIPALSRNSENGLCSHVKSCIYITSAGRLSPCMSLMNHVSTESVIDKTINELLTTGMYCDFINYFAGIKKDTNMKCYNCIFKDRCNGGCNAKLYREKDIKFCDEDSCILFNIFIPLLRKQLLGYGVSIE